MRIHEGLEVTSFGGGEGLGFESQDGIYVSPPFLKMKRGTI